MTDLRSRLQTTLGNAYSLERELGGGGMSRVFLAEEEALGRKVVVKVLPPDLSGSVNVDRFKREIQVAAKLQHAHIVPVLTAGEMSGIPYYTMPFVDGESMRARIGRTGPLPITEAIGLLRDVSKALAYAHDRGVVHRDIKPDNVMLSGGSAMVVDFGIAKAISASRTDAPGGTLTQVGTSIGTPAYMAPEQAAGDPATDSRADLYSFGCMAYEALTGRPPFTATTPHKLLAAHMTETPQHVSELRPDTPATLAALVMRCLEKDADKRPATASDIAHTLDSVTSDGAHPAMPPILIGGAGMFKRALLMYLAAFIAVAIVAKAAIVAIGLPDWVFQGSLIVMALGLPVILFTGYVHRTTRQLITMTPSLTPGGTPSMPQGTMQTLALKASPHMSWRRTTMGGAYALGGFIVLIGAFMLLRQLGIGPAGSLLAAGSLKEQEPLLVTDFKVTNADSSLGRVLSDAAKAQIGLSSVLSLWSPEAVTNALRRMDRPATATLDLRLARELATRNGIKALVDGEINGLGSNGFIVSLKLVTADSLKELASFRETAADARGLIDAVDKLAKQLRGRAGESLRKVNAAPGLAQVTTGSLEALRKYTEGERAENIEGNRPKAIALLREAVAIDTSFAEGWRKLGMTLSNSGAPRPQIDSAFAQAYKHRGRVPDRARESIVAAYYTGGPQRDRAKAIAAYEAMLRYGGDSAFANNLALLLVSRREFARAESLYGGYERRRPGEFRPLYGNLTVVQNRLGKFASAESTIARGLDFFPDMVGLKRARVNMLYMKGDSAQYRRSVDSVFTHGDSADKVWARTRRGELALLDGKIKDWRAIARVNRPAPGKATPRQLFTLAQNLMDAWVDATWLGQPKVVETRLDEAIAGYRGEWSPADHWNSIIAYSWAHKPDKARAILARYDGNPPDTAQRRQQLSNRANALAEILLAERKGEESALRFREGDRLPDGPVSACTICLPSTLSRAYDAAQTPDSAIKYYEQFVTMYTSERLGIYDPLMLAPYSRRLGELYEQRGDKAKAAKYYRNFVNLWTNADPELQQQVAEVRRRLSRLADVEGPR
jgi:tRNA A-37 threonylcarbamoyl transferase component Bud32/tetratricopeptide (TPR) repeat protein